MGSSVEKIVGEIEENRKAQEALKAEEAEKAKGGFEVHTTKPMKESGLEVHTVEPVIPVEEPAKEPVEEPVIEEPVIEEPIEEPVIEEPVKAEESPEGNENPKKESAFDKFYKKWMPPWWQ